MEQNPGIGRIVHYVTLSQEPARTLPAIITRVYDEGACDLEVFGAPNERLLLTAVACSAIPTEGQWHWPLRI